MKDHNSNVTTTVVERLKTTLEWDRTHGTDCDGITIKVELWCPLQEARVLHAHHHILDPHVFNESSNEHTVNT